MTGSLALDVDRIRREAQRTIDAGPVRSAYGPDIERVISVLNNVVAAEVVGWLRCTRQAILAHGTAPTPTSKLFEAQADRKMRHAVAVADRIVQLGGQPNFDPATLAQRARTDYSTADDAALRAMLEQNLLAARIVVPTYRQIAHWLGDRDPASRHLIESVLIDEKQNARDLTALLSASSNAPAPAPSPGRPLHRGTPDR
ncbi:ferritin-like domain-containing protein [Kitasatospora sp. NPDC056138]|uniref:ferritin-like domain-containing protein n=1 Tax=Kitasatospora sp. NPDC056138 TaxID=3345724 RepID=UPI0035D9F2D1